MLTIQITPPLTAREEEILRFVLNGAARGYYEQSPGLQLERPREAGLILDLDKAKAELADAREKILSLEKQIADSSASVDGRAPPAPSEAGAEEVVSAGLPTVCFCGNEQKKDGWPEGLCRSVPAVAGGYITHGYHECRPDAEASEALCANAIAATLPEKQLPNKGAQRTQGA